VPAELKQSVDQHAGLHANFSAHNGVRNNNCSMITFSSSFLAEAAHFNSLLSVLRKPARLEDTCHCARLVTWVHNLTGPYTWPEHNFRWQVSLFDAQFARTLVRI
jgi:hypothetical protein